MLKPRTTVTDPYAVLRIRDFRHIITITGDERHALRVAQYQRRIVAVPAEKTHHARGVLSRLIGEIERLIMDAAR